MTKPVGVIAAKGELPVKIADALKGVGREVFIVAIAGVADADFSRFEHEVIEIGALAKIIACLKAKGCDEVVLGGKLVRPSIGSLSPDALAAKVIHKLLSVGDNEALEMISDILAQEGITVIDTSSILVGNKVEAGLISGTPPPPEIVESINQGKALLLAMRGFDIGQSVVLQGRRVLAIEAAENTDEMLRRMRNLIDTDLTPPVFVKMMKPDQSRHLDAPFVGAQTATLAGEAGIGVIALEAGAVLIADMQEMLAEARAHNITIIGI